MVAWKYFYAFYTSLRKYYNLFVCLFRIIYYYFATYRFEIFRFCLRWYLFKNIDEDGKVFNFLSISEKAWCELWYSSHNEILTTLSWCLSSGYFKNHWGLKFISLEDDLTNVIGVDKKKFMAEHTNELIKKYEEFAQEARNGNHGKTAQYWMGYVDMLHLYHEFSRSIRTGDLDLYIYCLQRMTALFYFQSSKLLTLTDRVSRQVT